MKKIIALAVAAVVAAPAMADLTIGGTVAAGWSSSTDGYSTFKADAPAATSVWGAPAVTEYSLTDDKGREGFGIDTASISVKGSETLESGLTVAGYMTFAGATRSTTVGGENAGLSVSGDFGKVSIDNIKAGAYTESFGPADNFVGEFGTESSFDLIGYTAPAMGPVTLVLETTDGGEIGKGAGDYNPQVTAKIAAGAFSGRVAYQVKKNEANRVRVGGTFDAGMVKLAASYQNQPTDGYRYSAVGVVLPLGATEVGVSMVEAKDNTDGAKVKGASIGVSHDLSDNVSVSLKYNNYDSINTGEKETATTALMSLAF